VDAAPAAPAMPAMHHPVTYINSYSLYKCLVKLGITKKKRLMIDIIIL